MENNNEMLNLLVKIRNNTCPQELDIPLLKEYSKPLAEALENNTNVVSLNIGFVRMHIVDYTPFSRMLERNKSIKSLQLKLVKPEQLVQIAPGFAKNLALETFILDAPFVDKMGDRGMAELFSALKGNKTLTTLNLPTINFSKEAAEKILGCLQDEHCGIQSLNLHKSSVDGSKTALIQLISEALGKNKSLRHINIGGITFAARSSGNHPEENLHDYSIAFAKLFETLNKQNTTLSSLGLTEMVEHRSKHKMSLIEVIAKLLRENKSITELDISKNLFSGLGDTGCDLWRSRVIELTEDSFCVDSVDPVSRSIFLGALAVNSTLTKLNLSGTGMCSDSAQDIARVLLKNFTILDVPKFGEYHADVVWEKSIKSLLDRNQYLILRPKIRAEIQRGLATSTQIINPSIEHIIFQYMECDENPKILQELTQLGVPMPSIMFSIAGNSAANIASNNTANNALNNNSLNNNALNNQSGAEKAKPQETSLKF